jgi:hypothetical protein
MKGNCRESVVDVAQRKVVRCREDGYSMFEVLVQKHQVRHIEPALCNNKLDLDHLHRHLAARRILEKQHLPLFDS